MTATVRANAADPRQLLAKSPMTARQFVAIGVCVLLNALDGFDVLSISFASPGIAKEWGIDRAALGVVLSMDEWELLAERLRAARTSFVIEPHVRFKGQVGEQATMFCLDPCGNALEFKSFADPGQLFAK